MLPQKCWYLQPYRTYLFVNRKLSSFPIQLDQGKNLHLTKYEKRFAPLQNKQNLQNKQYSNYPCLPQELLIAATTHNLNNFTHPHRTKLASLFPHHSVPAARSEGGYINTRARLYHQLRKLLGVRPSAC